MDLIDVNFEQKVVVKVDQGNQQNKEKQEIIGKEGWKKLGD